MRVGLVVALALALAACGKAGAPGAGGAHAEACALIAQPEALFGAGAVVEGDDGLDDMAGVCRFHSVDGMRSGDIVLYTAKSVRGDTLAQRLEKVAQQWDALTETPLAPIEGLGEDSRLAKDLPGYQTQIVFRKGERLVLILGNSGDPKMDGEKLARAMAQAAAAAP